MQSFFSAFPDEIYLEYTLTVLYLCRQQTFISDERGQCPLIRNTSLLIMIMVTRWINKRRLEVANIVEEYDEAYKPDKFWYVTLYLSIK